MLKIALTGGIGSGKSTVCDLFRQLGVPILSADAIAKEILAPGSQAYQQVCQIFGNKVLGNGGALDRQKLRQLIFNDATERARLDDIMHPLIRDTITHRLTILNAPYAIIEIPLLCESKQAFNADRVLVIDAPESAQLSRTSKRDNITKDKAKQILEAQASREERLKIADDVIDNSSDVESLSQRVQELHAKYSTIRRESLPFRSQSGTE